MVWSRQRSCCRHAVCLMMYEPTVSTWLDWHICRLFWLPSSFCGSSSGLRPLVSRICTLRAYRLVHATPAASYFVYRCRFRGVLRHVPYSGRRQVPQHSMQHLQVSAISYLKYFKALHAPGRCIPACVFRYTFASAGLSFCHTRLCFAKRYAVSRVIFPSDLV